MNDISSRNEFYLFRVDENRRHFKVFIMQPLSHRMIEYTVRKKKSGFKLKAYSTGSF